MHPSVVTDDHWVIVEHNPLIAEGKVPLFWSGPPEEEMPFMSGSFSGDITSAAVFRTRVRAFAAWKKATGRRALPKTMTIAKVGLFK